MEAQERAEKVAAWKAAQARLAEIEAERSRLTAHLANDLKIAREAEQDALDALPFHVTDCEGCGEPIFEGDKAHHGVDCYLCETCAPTYGDVLEQYQQPEASAEDYDMTPQEFAEAIESCKAQDPTAKAVFTI